MEDLSLHILDIVENSLRANAKNIEVRLIQNEEKDQLILEVIDDGEGMNEETVRQSLDPFFTTKTGKKVGLGLPFLVQAAEEADGELKVESIEGRGTRVVVTFRLSHVDRKPLGNVEETMKCLKATHPEVSFRFEHVRPRDLKSPTSIHPHACEISDFEHCPTFGGGVRAASVGQFSHTRPAIGTF